MARIATLCLLSGLGAPLASLAQDVPRDRLPVIDTIAVVTRNIFGREETRSSVLFRIANGIRFKTRSSVVRRELLFRTGEAYDSARVAETERNLRRLGLFRDVTIDTVRIGQRLAVIVETLDGWTTELVLNARSTGRTFTWSAGVLERNFLGTATRVGASYRKESDRTAVTLVAGMVRAFGSSIDVRGLYDDLSDGTRGQWTLGVPFRAFTDRTSFQLRGGAGRERVLQYRDGDLFGIFRRRSFLQAARVAFAPHATTSSYVRFGLAAQVKREEYLLQADTGLAIPDTVTGAVGVFGELVRARFKVVTHYNGFAREHDLDLSSRVSLAAWLAPAAFGYRETGVGLGLSVQSGISFGRNFARLRASANGLFTSTGLDSGRVSVAFTIVSQGIPKSATVLHVQAGVLRGVPPGAEFDIGHGRGPRAFGPHAFTGTRSVWGALEHRAFLIDEVLGLLGIGFAAFVDYGGAWFADQSRRLGGDVGFGLRFGATRSTGPNVGRIDLAYRFGEGFGDKRWAVSFGRGFGF